MPRRAFGEGICINARKIVLSFPNVNLSLMALTEAEQGLLCEPLLQFFGQLAACL